MSKAHRWPGNDTPLTGCHGGTAAAARRAIKEAKAARLAPIVAKAKGEAVATFVRKDRRRPKVRTAVEKPAPPPPAKPLLPWLCRQDGRFHRERRRGARISRTMEMSLFQRFVLYVAQEGICALCGKPMEGRCVSFSIDHVIPYSLGGIDVLGNVVLCHSLCNSVKSNDTPTGCEMVFLLAVNCRLGVQPQTF